MSKGATIWMFILLVFILFQVSTYDSANYDSCYSECREVKNKLNCLELINQTKGCEVNRTFEFQIKDLCNRRCGENQKW